MASMESRELSSEEQAKFNRSLESACPIIWAVLLWVASGALVYVVYYFSAQAADDGQYSKGSEYLAVVAALTLIVMVCLAIGTTISARKLSQAREKFSLKTGGYGGYSNVPKDTFAELVKPFID